MTDAFHAAWIDRAGHIGTTGAAREIFPWWSFTKTALAVCALRLVEDGALQLDAPRPGKPYTLRQLLQHRAGVRNYGRLQSYHDAVTRGDAPWSRAELLEAAGAERLDFEPGAGWAYSNIGYLYVRDAIAEAAGMDAGEAMRRWVLAPLRLSSAKWAGRASDFSDIHWPAGRDYHPGWVYHGCLKGTAIDAARLLHAVFDGDILNEKSRAAILSAYPLGGAIAGRPWTECGYGLGVMTGRMGEAGRAIGHSGAGPFSAKAVYHFPDRSTPVTVAVFTDGTDEARAEHEASRIALESG